MPRPREYATDAARMKAYRLRKAEKIAARAAERTTTGIPAAPAVSSIPATTRWKSLIDQARTLLDQAQTEMEDYYADRSEKWQESDNGEKLTERIEQIQGAIDALDE